MDLLAVGLNSQSVLVRRLQLRQLRATLSKGQIFSIGVRSFPSSVPLTFNGDSLCCCVSAGQWSTSEELCCVLSLDPPSTERATRFLPVPGNPDTPLDWSEEMTLYEGICVLYLCVVEFYFKSNTAAFCVLKGAEPGHQRAESQTSGAEWQEGT